MTFGYSTNAFVKFSLLEAIDKIHTLGFHGVEIMCDRPHLYPPEYDDARLAQVKQSLEQNQLKVTNLNSFTLFAVGDTYLPSWIEPDPERRAIRIKHTQDCLKVAETLGCANISVPPGGPLNGMDRQEAFKLFYQGLDEVIPLAEELDIKIVVEPEPDLLMENTQEFKTFMGFGMTVDIYPQYIVVNSIAKISYFSRKGEFIKEKKISTGTRMTPLNDKSVGNAMTFDQKTGPMMSFNLYDNKGEKTKEICSIQLPLLKGKGTLTLIDMISQINPQYHTSVDRIARPLHDARDEVRKNLVGDHALAVSEHRVHDR